MMTNKSDLHKEWIKAKSKIARSDATFGRIPKNIIVPGDHLYSLKLESCGAYGMRGGTVVKTLCSRCGRIGGKNEDAFGILVTFVDRTGDKCDDCGVTLYDLQCLQMRGGNE